MRASLEMTDGKKALVDILSTKPSSSSEWNEAQNRFQFVDRLLVECLGWQQPDIEVENHDGLGGYSDYNLGRNAVLEVKREAILFELPPGKGLVRKLPSLLANSKNLNAAIKQVIPYCAMRGAHVAAICNGPQLIIFQAFVTGGSPLDGECYVFDGFDSYLNDFNFLWKILSPEGVQENQAYRLLSVLRNPRIPPKASISIPEPYKYRYRSNFQENVRSLSSLLLEEIEDNPNLKADFYSECYIPLQANNRHLLMSKKIIESRYRRVAGDGVNPASLDEITIVDAGKSINFSDPTVGNNGARPIVVVGDIGVGKTSFFENLYQNLSGADKSSTYFIHLNLGLKATLTDDIKGFILDEIPSMLRKQYEVDIFEDRFVRSIYHQDIQDFASGVRGRLKDIDPTQYERDKIEFLSIKVERKDEHLRKSLAHLAFGRRKQIILVLDNADQRSFQVQQETFLIAQEFAATRAMLVFVALRPSTFYQSKSSGSLAAYQNKLLTISPPPADEVVQKRILFAIRVATGEVAPGSLDSIRLHLISVVHFLRATSRSIRSSDQIKQFLSNISGGNTRAIIELITGFFGSPNVDSTRIVELEEKNHNYRIPFHEFTKHALLGDYAYFNSQSSLVACNIYDVFLADPREHFLGHLIVAFLSSNTGYVDNDGFVSGSIILREIAKQGFVPEQISMSARRLATKRLIETPHAHYREIPVPDEEGIDGHYFRATTVGIYHIRHWCGSFAFLDAVSIDTPIFNEKRRIEVVKEVASFRIEHRYQRTIAFRSYLEEQWHLANIAADYYDFPEVLKSQEVTFESVQGPAERSASIALGDQVRNSPSSGKR
ncbi:hypothetical protein ACE15N_16085 [Xanthomonas campestris pv. passiflorae]|uniref:hypothetical protein n=1 Tax=Xanthomonas campestris TaxID=339 RepID=UPI0024224109|nr:hypothetical protein [Xanthomonas campestris]MBV6815936.1 hypothetical protein [Xanthomonas campestris pv. passiflorae]